LERCFSEGVFLPVITTRGEPEMKRIAVLLAVSAALCTPALAEEVGVGVGPVGVTVGSGPDHVVREKEVIREREPHDKVIIKKERSPTVVEKEKKTIIHHD
jgi:hypothetical protein